MKSGRSKTGQGEPSDHDTELKKSVSSLGSHGALPCADVVKPLHHYLSPSSLSWGHPKESKTLSWNPRWTLIEPRQRLSAWDILCRWMIIFWRGWSLEQHFSMFVTTRQLDNWVSDDLSVPRWTHLWSIHIARAGIRGHNQITVCVWNFLGRK